MALLKWKISWVNFHFIVFSSGEETLFKYNVKYIFAAHLHEYNQHTTAENRKVSGSV